MHYDGRSTKKKIHVCVVAGKYQEFDRFRSNFRAEDLIEFQRGSSEFETEKALFRYCNDANALRGMGMQTYVIAIGTYREVASYDRNLREVMDIIQFFDPKRVQVPVDPKKWIGKNGKQLPVI